MDHRRKKILMGRLEADAERIARQFGLEYRTIAAERANVKSRFGICYSDGTIKIRLHHAATGRPLKYSSLVATLCHELAHLKYFNHGKRFQRFNHQLLEWCRRERIYSPQARGDAPAQSVQVVPTPAQDQGVRQLELFD
ncbi:MAG: M48 family metallopeptidase [Myxococcota bacterium]|nr:M48 family metallopeptidase [Myxococcota bacterium]